MPLYACEEDEVMALQERVSEAQRTAKLELKDIDDRKGMKAKHKREGATEFDDTEQFMGARKRFKGPQNNGGGGGRKKFKGKR